VASWSPDFYRHWPARSSASSPIAWTEGAILVASDLARAALVLGVAFTQYLVAIYVLAFLMGASRALFDPSVRAAFPSIVGRGDPTRANALIGGTFSASITIGPALGGLLVAAVGVEAAFALDAATYLVSAALLSRIRLPRPDTGENEGFVRELQAGLSYLARARVPLGIVVGGFLAMLATDLATPAEVFLAKETFGAGDVGYGLLVSLWGVGMVLGSALIAALGDKVNLMPAYFSCLFAWALAFAGAGLAPTFVLALGALAVAGAANGVDNAATDTILQNRVPDAFLGRVFSVRLLGFGVAEVLAYPAGGLIVDTFGPRSSYLIAGIATAVVGCLVLIFIFAVPTKRI
jgi:MFS family permease